MAPAFFPLYELYRSVLVLPETGSIPEMVIKNGVDWGVEKRFETVCRTVFSHFNWVAGVGERLLPVRR